MLRRILLAALFLTVTACAAVDQTTGLPPPESDTKAPGMIPQECEALLQKSQEWGYTPGNKWLPESREQALSALAFFQKFSFVPAVSSDFFRAFTDAKIPEGAEEREAMFDQSGKAQVCDFALASQFLNGLLRYPWAKEDRPQVSKAFHVFALNQQVKAMPLLPRLTAIQIYAEAAKAGLAPGKASSFFAISKEGEQAIAKTKGITDEEQTHEQVIKSSQEELQISERLREKMAKLLPLP